MDDNSLPGETLKCSYPNCGKLLSSKYNLKRHIESCHYGFRPYECNICYKKFSSKQNKREHIRLEHSYSSADANYMKAGNKINPEDMAIPNLSMLICNSVDPDIRPLSKVERIFLYADLSEKVELPVISSERQNSCLLPSHID